LFKKKSNDKTKYKQRDVPHNFGTGSGAGEIGNPVVVLVANSNNSRSTNVVLNTSSIGLAICLEVNWSLESMIQKDESFR
jgi:uncharacterized spore protein YtfJ